MIKKFEKTFESLSKTHDNYIVFNSLLDYIINMFSLNQKVEWEYNFKQEEIKQIHDLSMKLLSIMDLKLENNEWYDFLGEFYEDKIISSNKATSKGQFFTPITIVDFMVEISCRDMKNKKGNFINDACCGSGRMLLSAHSKFNGNYFLGQDLDLQACKMSVVNFLLHGCVGSVMYMDSLSNEFFHGWRVNNYLNYGVPLPHVEQVNTRGQCYNLIGLDNGVKTRTIQTKLF